MRRPHALHKPLDALFKDEKGSTTLSMVISLLITLALIFTSAQVYRINTIAAEVQDVADAAALAAENQVAEFMIAVQFCDAVVLSLSLTGLVSTSLGIVALCIPPTAGLAKDLIETGRRILKARDDFAERATNALNKLQRAVPYIAAVSAANVASQNSSNMSGSQYIGFALLVNAQGDPIEIDISHEEDELLDKVDQDFESIKEKAQEAEEAAKKAQESKQRAYEHDCGNAPSYCMYERAEHLAGMSGGSNPYFASVDTWSFANALERAKAYYRLRLENEAPSSGSAADQARSALRKLFYRYADDQMAYAYVHETSESFEAYFPHLPRNTAEMRQTRLYTDNSFPITQEQDGTRTMHAWSGCPAVQGIIGWGSLSFMEAEDMSTCDACSFSAASLGKVAAASTSIENGFEYHYEIVATEAKNYQAACEKLSGPRSEVQDEVTDLFLEASDLFKSAFGKRISATPPGRYGAIAFVINRGVVSAAGAFQNSFVNSGGTLGARAAVSAATLVGEDSNEGKTVINSFLDGLSADSGVAIGAAGVILNAWSFLLQAYTKGNDALVSGIKNALDSIPLVGPSGLGTWAAKKLSSLIEDLGLQPVELRAFKAILVNSARVAERGEDSFSRNYLAVKGRIVSASAGATDAFSMILNDAQASALEKIQSTDDTIQIASIELLGNGGISIPISIPLPKVLKSPSASLVEQLFDQIRSIQARIREDRIWQ